MVLERFTIVLDNVDATYFPGQQIAGNVHIWNNIAKNVKGNHLFHLIFNSTNLLQTH